MKLCTIVLYVAVVWASFVREWQEFGREKLRWVAIGFSMALSLLPIILAERAFGSHGFEQSGGSGLVAVYVVLGWMTLQVAQQALLSGQGYIRWASGIGVLPHIWSTAAPRWLPIGGVALFEIAQTGILAGILSSVFSWMSDDALNVNTVGMIVVVGCGVSIFWSSGIALAGVGLISRQWRVPYLIGGTLFVLAGSTFPISVLPAPIRAMSYLLPHTYVVDMVRYIVLDTPTMMPLELELSLLIVWAFVSIAIGVRMFIAIDRVALSKGLIGLYT